MSLGWDIFPLITTSNSYRIWDTTLPTSQSVYESLHSEASYTVRDCPWLNEKRFHRFINRIMSCFQRGRFHPNIRTNVKSDACLNIAFIIAPDFFVWVLFLIKQNLLQNIAQAVHFGRHSHILESLNRSCS